jgi:ribose-phosphate pyrophosphokinase
MQDYGINRFPDGQIQFWGLASYGRFRELTCSLFTSEDLDLFYQIINTIVLDKITVKYIYGARCDKDSASPVSLCNLAKQFEKNILNSLNNKPHKYVFWNPHCTFQADFKIEIPIPDNLKELLDGDFFTGVIYPDESAYRRMKHVFPNLPSVVGTKKRDQKTGKILSYSVAPLAKGKYLVADDICDGGATFEELGKTQSGEVQLFLYVTHGLFSKGAETLEALRKYQLIWCTDSCPKAVELGFATKDET